jgi:hypothetical protein
MNVLLISYHLISNCEQDASGSDGNFGVAWVEYRRIVGYSDRSFSSFLSVSKLYYLDKSTTASFCILSNSLFTVIKVTGRHILLEILAAC